MMQQHTPWHTSRHVFLGFFVLFWIGLTAFGLYWFQGKTVRPFLSASDHPMQVQTHYLSEQLRPLIEQGSSGEAVVMIHFWNPDCLCNQVSRRHFTSLIQSADNSTMAVIAVTPKTTTDSQITEFQRLNGDRIRVLRRSIDDVNIPASPALALFQKKQGVTQPEYRLSYFGAYGFGALCSLSDENFFPNMVMAMQKNDYGPFINVAGSGCFCAWNNR